MSKRKPKTHVVKAWSEFFQQVVTGLKTAELRKNDRDYRAGDKLLLQEFDERRGIYCGKECLVDITAVIDADHPVARRGLKKGYCVLSIRQSLYGTRWNPEAAGKAG